MTAKILSIANQKGGVGKTTTAINLASALAREGLQVVIADLDPQGSTTSGLGCEKVPGSSLYSVLHGDGDGDARSKIKETNEKGLFLIPAEIDLAAIEIELGQKANYLIQLRQCLAPLKASDEYQVIILDCPPALGLLSMNSLSAADYLLVALQCEYLAMEGLSQILRVVNQLKESGVNDQLSVGGIIMTMFDVRTNISRQVVDEVKKHFPELLFKTLIPRSVRLSEAPSYGQSIFQYDPLSSGAKAYAKLGQEVIERFQLKKPSNA